MANFLIIFAPDIHDKYLIIDMVKQKKKQNTDIKENNLSENVDNQQLDINETQPEEIKEETKEEEKEVKSEKRFFSKSKNDKKVEKMAVEMEELQKELEETKIQLAEYKDKFLRLFSEFDNYKKRTAKEKVDLIATGNSQLILKLLQVVDDIDRADKSMQEATDVEAVRQGSDLIFEKFKSVLRSAGLEEIESTGTDFNTDEHEAIAQFPAGDESQKNKVIDTTQKGYKLNGKIIRVAQVVVGC